MNDSEPKTPNATQDGPRDDAVAPTRLPATDWLKELHSQAAEAVAILDCDMRFAEVNSATARLLGLPADALVAQPLTNLLYDQTQSDVLQRDLCEVVNSGVCFRELTLRDGTGEPLHVALSGTLITVNGHPRMKAYLRDITHQKEAEAEITRLHHQVISVLESTTDAYIAVDTGWRIQYVNQRAEEMFGSARMRLLNQPLWECLPQLEVGFGTLTRDVAKRRTSVNTRGFYVPGSKWLEAHIHPQPDGVALYLRDISEQVRAEQQLRSLARFPDESPSPIMRINHDGILLYANHASEVILSRWHIGVGKQVPGDIRTACRSVLHTGKVRDFEYQANERMFSLLLVPVTDDRYINVYGRDVTESHLAQRELRMHRDNLELLVKARTKDLAEARDQAEQANRAKSAFLANMSHELRTPLNAVIGYAEMLRDGAEESNRPEDVRDLNRIHNAATHLLEIINDILDLSKIEADKIDLNIDDIDLPSFLTSVTSTAKPLAARNNNEIVTTLPPNLVAISGDLMRIRQCLLNLVSNACKFTKNGTITVNMYAEHRGGEKWLVASVSDTGIGMSDEQLTRLFKPFTQVHNQTSGEFGGTGLGLALTHRLVQLMGGEIAVSSAVGKGSTFTLKLPIAVTAPRASGVDR
mgnify:CR=1 FL=1